LADTSQSMDSDAFVARIQELFPRIVRYLDVQEDRELIGLDCTPAQMGALIALARSDPRTMGELAWDLALTESAATRLVDRLVRTNLVRRDRDRTDRRIVRVWLSTYGRQLVEVVLARRREQFERVSAHMAPEERQRLVQGLEAVVRVFAQLEHE
jgi:DNA-binding MarR family transcriptional regulator